jgi:5-formyltetrahydrofolate cyclo-ligase
MKNELSNTKKKMRKKMLDLRASLGPADIAKKSSLVQKLLFDLPEFRQAQVVMFYVSFRSEVKTGEMIQAALDLDKKIVVPAVSSDRQALEPYFIDSLDQLTPGTYGVPEPKSREKRADSGSIDLITVPGCAFDPEGFRLGYGGGYYDRFLGQDQNAAAVGLAFELQMVPKVPALKPHDLPVDLIVTEKRVIRCRRSPQA